MLLVRLCHTTHTQTASALTPHHHRDITMAPKAKLSASQKAANKAAGIEKRKRTMAVKAAERRANDPVLQATAARA